MQHVFKMEQEEYVREGINWSNIDFVDNQDMLDLIEKVSTIYPSYYILSIQIQMKSLHCCSGIGLIVTTYKWSQQTSLSQGIHSTDEN